MRFKEVARLARRFLLPVLALVLTVGLAGCASGSLTGAFSGASSKKTATAPVSFAPIIGAPANVSSQLSSQLLEEARKKDIQVITEHGKSAEYTVRGYLAASQDRNANKVAYIWDVTDKSGKRVHRILGEETTPLKPGRDAWSTFDETALRKIASKTAADLAAWLPKQAASPAAAPQPAAAKKRQTAPPPKTRKPKQVARRTPSGPIAAYVPAVKGAPGDGRKSLTGALRKQLAS
ncbi:MAG: hypothetical protein D6773_16730, partial [Alphaproteobacteria bacterium]